MKKLFFASLLLCSTCLAWEEDPRLKDHDELTELLLKLGDMQNGVTPYSKELARELIDELENYLEEANEESP